MRPNQKSHHREQGNGFDKGFPIPLEAFVCSEGHSIEHTLKGSHPVLSVSDFPHGIH
jgi:hypothetical protein